MTWGPQLEVASFPMEAAAPRVGLEAVGRLCCLLLGSARLQHMTDLTALSPAFRLNWKPRPSRCGCRSKNYFLLMNPFTLQTSMWLHHR